MNLHWKHRSIFYINLNFHSRRFGNVRVYLEVSIILLYDNNNQNTKHKPKNECIRFRKLCHGVKRKYQRRYESMITDKAQIELSKIVDLFSTKELPNVFTKAYIKTFGKPCKKWSMGNKIIIALSGTSDARGFNQWKQVERHVKAGSKAVYILAPMIKKKIEIDEKSKEEKEVEYLAGFMHIPVFRVEDTEGKELEVYKPKELPKLLDVAEKWGLKVIYDDSEIGEFGSFNPSTDTIRLCTESQDVFFHELAHKAHSKLEKLKMGQDPEQETIAQLTACVLSQMFGYDALNDSYNYIAGYAGSKKPEAVGKMCLRVLAKVEKILDMILSETIDKPMIKTEFVDHTKQTISVITNGSEVVSN